MSLRVMLTCFLAALGTSAGAFDAPVPQTESRRDVNLAPASASSAVRRALTVSCYDVRGSNFEAIERSLRSNGPRERYRGEADKGPAREALFRWNIRWHWEYERGLPRYESATIELRTSLILPCWNDGDVAGGSEETLNVPNLLQLRRAWRRYRQAVVDHETEHYRLVNEGAERLARDLRRMPSSASPLEAERYAQRALGKIRARNLHWDEKTDHGRRDGVRWRL